MSEDLKSFSLGESSWNFVVVINLVCVHGIDDAIASECYTDVLLILDSRFLSFTSGNIAYICTCGRKAVRCSTVMRIESKMSHTGI